MQSLDFLQNLSETMVSASQNSETQDSLPSFARCILKPFALLATMLSSTKPTQRMVCLFDNILHKVNNLY